MPFYVYPALFGFEKGFPAENASEIFIWDDHYDRYLITDLIGIGMGNGYDTTSNPNDITT